ncbi:PDZ/DHR/GLGF domain protein [Methylobacterium sp. 4-46]|uniref:S1C family serine protease n=1 Tax=unclassified Methylobacterium TaxID=2615210 RepID=UPI000152D53F|nr:MULTISPECIES: S1C family serine protease [Methylobacterium]ACA16949.1 PDZ/DHR/GLGF domain protein [Methylobacterium sp. 4-46]WFT82635.1 S1C family serine protease [Methylobacterium nodulans]
MAPSGDWKIPLAAQPRPADYAFDLDRALAAVLSLSARVPEGAFTADALGTERAGNGVLIGADGLVLTIGYLITEAESVWLTTQDGRSVPGHVVGFDAVTGFGLVQALGRLDCPVLPLGRSAALQVGQGAIFAGTGGRSRAVAAKVVARQSFAGYWEYVLDDAIFTAPSHPHWGGAGLIGPNGDLLGIGSLQLQQGGSEARALNMAVPIDLLTPILDDLTSRGRVARPPRPWLGLYATEIDDEVVVMGLAKSGPAAAADLRSGDTVLDVAGAPVPDLGGFFRQVWALGEAGVAVPLTVRRDGRTLAVTVQSADRERFLLAPRFH